VCTINGTHSSRLRGTRGREILAFIIKSVSFFHFLFLFNNEMMTGWSFPATAAVATVQRQNEDASGEWVLLPLF